MKIDDKRPLGVDLPQLIKDGRPVSTAQKKGDHGAGQPAAVTKVSISSEARKLQRVAALAEEGDMLRAEKVSRLKEQLSSGEYHVEAAEVARGIARSEIARLLGKE